MTSSLARRALLAACLIAVSVSGCRSSKVTGVGCSSDDDCRAQFNGSDRAFCDQSKNPPECALHPKQCDTAADCCPAQVCNAQGHYCFDKYLPCTQDGSCPAQGEVCKEIGVFAKGLGCTFNKPDPTGACPAGTNVFNKYCVGEPPCNGGCKNTASPVCITATNLCSPAPKDASCAQTCPSGKILVLQDPTNIFDTCNNAAERCECDSLPPLQVRDVARHSSMTASGQNLFVSAYDGEHGDLVVHTFDKADLSKPQKSEWLDGVPATGTIGGDVNGPRHGIITPGPDVGQYTSIVASPTGDLYVAYYDVDNGDLKFIARYGGPAAAWSAPITIDGSTTVGSAPTNGDVGMYASIALDASGIPAIAYFRRGSYDANAVAETGPSTALLYAVAKRTQPLTKDDWVVVGAGNAVGADVDQANRPPPPCNSACGSSQICVVDPNSATGDRCADKSTAQCNPTLTPAGCTGNQVCVVDTDANHSAVCRTSKAAEVLGELPTGVGLMPSLAFLDGHPVIAYYENLKNADGTPLRAVKAVMGSGSGLTPTFGTPVEIDGHIDPDPNHAGQFVATTRDTGRWPALAIGPTGQVGGRIAIAFADLSAQQLLIYQADTLTAHSGHVLKAGDAGSIRIVDNGVPAAGEAWHPQSFPGAQTSIAFTPSGKVALAYQDSTPVDLMFAVYDPVQGKTASRTTVRPTGAAGFWPHMAIVSGTAYLSSATIKAATASIPFNQLFVDAKPAP
jgi:hypothetical protein